MLVTIITVTFNSEKTILETLNSVMSQNYTNIEHIIVDGQSTDRTLQILKKYPFKNKKIISKKDRGAYDAMNVGIAVAKGDIITILNSDDIYNSPDVIKDIMKRIEKYPKDIGIFCGDVAYFKNKRYEEITRIYPSKFERKDILKGHMPPHPATFVRKNIYKKYGTYDAKLKIASDFDFFVRTIYKNNIKFKSLNFPTVRMRIGGLSTKNLISYIKTTYEIAYSFKKNGIRYGWVKSFFRIPSKIKQLMITDYERQWKKTFEIKRQIFYKNQSEQYFIILKNIKKLFLIKKKGFILSAMNLAFLGFYTNGSIKSSPHMINWPDGVFSKLFGRYIEKIPGRDVLNKLILPKKIKKIVVLGNLHKKSELFLKKKFSLPIAHFLLDYGSSYEIFNSLKYKASANDLIFITLPTPKQEEIANLIVANNTFAKIVCIGGSVAIASGVEKKVPDWLVNIEFLWRLRYETLRRTKRLIQSFYFFFKGNYLTSKIKNMDIEIA